MDTKKSKEKASGELHNNSVCCFEQFLEAIPHKPVTILPLLSHLKKHPSKTNTTCRRLLKKQGRTHVHLWTLYKDGLVLAYRRKYG